jgi:periplasmic divalent cation tolerance protein
MSEILFVYITCKNPTQAKEIGTHLLEKRLCSCINIIPHMTSLYFWPPKTGEIVEDNEVILIAKTSTMKYHALETETKRAHSYENPCICAVPVIHVAKEYKQWLLSEME